MAGHFITFEGGEGTGKSTQAGLLAKKLSGNVTDKVIIVFRHPNGTLGDWPVTCPTGWGFMSGKQRRAWAIRRLARWNSTYTYLSIERNRR